MSSRTLKTCDPDVDPADVDGYPVGPHRRESAAALASATTTTATTATAAATAAAARGCGGGVLQRSHCQRLSPVAARSRSAVRNSVPVTASAIVIFASPPPLFR